MWVVLHADLARQSTHVSTSAGPFPSSPLVIPSPICVIFVFPYELLKSPLSKTVPRCAPLAVRPGKPVALKYYVSHRLRPRRGALPFVRREGAAGRRSEGGEEGLLDLPRDRHPEAVLPLRARGVRLRLLRAPREQVPLQTMRHGAVRARPHQVRLLGGRLQGHVPLPS